MSFDYAIDRVIGYKDDLASVVLKGSRLDEPSLDYWSDTDVVYLFKDDITITDDYVTNFLNGFGKPVALEKYVDVRYCMIRGIFEIDKHIEEWDIMLVNLKNIDEDYTFPAQSLVIYGEPIELQYESTKETICRSYDTDWIESVWYKMFASVKRLCRGDNLIGVHLLLDVYRDLLVVKMIDRDVERNTTIHRFGFNETLSDLNPLSDINVDNMIDMVEYLSKLGKCFDTMMIDRFSEYDSRHSIFDKYCAESIRELTI